MSESLGLGKIITTPQQRDAIHIAVAPVVAGMRLDPGQHVGADGRTDSVAVGIVDPFLTRTVSSGQTFWLFLYPETVTGMRHHWKHPDFDAVNKDASERWLRVFIAKSDCPDYDTVMNAAVGDHHKNDGEDNSSYNDDGVYLHFNGWDAHGDIPPEFWDHVEVVTGKKIPHSERARKFSCSC